MFALVLGLALAACGAWFFAGWMGVAWFVFGWFTFAFLADGAMELWRG